MHRHTYTKCADNHEIVYDYTNHAIVTKLDTPTQYWDTEKQSRETIPIINLGMPALLRDEERIYLFVPYHRPIPLCGRKK